MKNKEKEQLTPLQVYRRMELKNSTLGCLAALGYLVLRFAVIAAFVVGIIWLICRLQPWN